MTINDRLQLLHALEEAGCAICRLADEAVAEWRRILLNESANGNDRGVRERLLRSGGLCREHAWRLMRPEHGLSAAIINRDLLVRFRDSLGSHPAAPARCPACIEYEMTAQQAIALLIGCFDDPDIRIRFEASDGLCRRHFDLALAAGRGGPDALVLAQIVCLSSLLVQMGEVIRGLESRVESDLVGSYFDSRMRAIASVSGLDAEALPRRLSQAEVPGVPGAPAAEQGDGCDPAQRSGLRPT